LRDLLRARGSAVRAIRLVHVQLGMRVELLLTRHRAEVEGLALVLWLCLRRSRVHFHLANGIESHQALLSLVVEVSPPGVLCLWAPERASAFQRRTRSSSQ